MQFYHKSLRPRIKPALAVTVAMASLLFVAHACESSPVAKPSTSKPSLAKPAAQVNGNGAMSKSSGATNIATDDIDTSKSNLLTNPSFEVDGKGADESLIPGWAMQFRLSATAPGLSATEASVVDDPTASHSGHHFLRIEPSTRDVYLRSPIVQSFEPGLYQLSAWVRGRPGTIAGFGLPALNMMFGAGINQVDEHWQKFSMVLYSKGLPGSIPWPDSTQVLVAVFAPGNRGQTTNPQLDIDDVTLTRLTSGLADEFGDHMVLQCDKPVPVWGWAKDPGQTVTLKFNGQTKTAIADGNGRWRTVLAPMKAGGPYVINVDGRPAAFDVMLGDVWVCSGQSNMEFGIDLLNGYYNHAPEIVAQADHRDLRLWTAAKQFSPTPMHEYLTRQSTNPIDYQATWNVCLPSNVLGGIWGGFSAVGYFFGRDIAADQHVTVGLMMIANGGTQIESFISPEGLAAIPQDQWVVPPITQAVVDSLHNTPFPKLADGIEPHSLVYNQQVAEHMSFDAMQGGPDGNAFHFASSAYNGLMSPVFPMAVRGVIWYQGEHNGGDSHYAVKLKALISDWRTRFQDPNLPFIIAQLPSWRPPDSARWQLVRESQLQVSQTVPHTGLAVTLDLADKEGDGYGVGEIHPKQKLPVGQRLALAARAVAYGEKLVSSGPIYNSVKITGNRATLTFDSVGTGLAAHGDKLIGFQIAGADHKFVDADAAIVGSTIVVSAPSITVPLAVRYAFAQFMLPVPNLYNKENLPASPFRTDSWPVE